MKWEFNKKEKTVTIKADHDTDIPDVEELQRVVGIISILTIDYVTDPLWDILPGKIVIHTLTEEGVTDFKFMAMSRTFKPFKAKTEKKD
nr:MAG TPA: hypothetical protein [Caudoviricetes sp.]